MGYCDNPVDYQGAKSCHEIKAVTFAPKVYKIGDVGVSPPPRNIS